MSEHPVGKALVRAAERRLDIPSAGEFLASPGEGVQARSEGRQVFVGSASLMRRHDLELSTTLGEAAAQLAGAGKTVVLAGWDGAVRGLVALEDAPRPEARAVVEALRDRGIAVALLTGDNAGAAASVAAAVGIDRVVAGVLPGGKAAEIARLANEGRVVAMVGDGINDAPALAQADLGIAIGTGSDVAIETADITLLSPNLTGVPAALELSARTNRTIRQNLAWAFAYNIFAMPLAALGVLSPAFAAAAMGVSSISVVGNSLRLYRFAPRLAERTGTFARRRRRQQTPASEPSLGFQPAPRSPST
jgi:P-type E1-E2 ATPase